ncbi:hypothetical protein HN587_02305 [Candidatus Woesearchaeota archaeon]|jgi:thiol-disulfide isomerase/thioredoxin|nr:hypothetical protein [Candidatus Woesearchaeota archaeon]
MSEKKSNTKHKKSVPKSAHKGAKSDHSSHKAKHSAHAHNHKAHSHKSSKSSKNLINVVRGLMVLLLVLALYNSFSIFQLSKSIGPVLEMSKTVSAPAKISLTVINPVGCDSCFDIGSTVAVTKSKIEVVEETQLNFGSAKATELISQYGIEKLPTIIATGEVEKAKLFQFKKSGDALIFNKHKMPYADALTGNSVGDVTVTYITADSCTDCYDWTPVITSLESNGVFVSNVVKVDHSSVEGMELVNSYDILKVPTLIFSSDLGVYPDMVSMWDSIGTVESDGNYVLREVTPPYFDLTKNSVAGFVGVTFLNDSSCSTCYDVMVHETILGQMGLVFDDSSVVDISSAEGKELVAKYSIVSVPTVLLDSGASAYSGLSDVWSSVGTVESDGTYIFRKIEAMNGVYKDLSTGELVGPTN